MTGLPVGGFIVVFDTASAKLYFTALANDRVAQDGEAMLIEQARASQMAWWGNAVPYEELVEVIRGRK